MGQIETKNGKELAIVAWCSKGVVLSRYPALTLVYAQVHLPKSMDFYFYFNPTKEIIAPVVSAGELAPLCDKIRDDHFNDREGGILVINRILICFRSAVLRNSTNDPY